MLMAYAPGVAIALAAGLALLVGCRWWHASEKYLLALLPSAGLLALARMAQTILDAPNFDWAGARLAPLVGLLHDHCLYHGPTTGPVFNTIYSPLSYLAYAPALLVPTGVPTILLASTLGLGWFFGPVLWHFLRMETDRPGGRIFALFGFLLFVLAAYLLPCLRMSLEGTIHDSPSLGLACLACLALYHGGTGSLHAVILSSLCAVLACWSKQVYVPLLAALPIWTFALEGRRACLRHLLALGLAGAGVSALFVGLLGSQPMFFNVWTLPASHPWNGRLPFNLLSTCYYFCRESFLVVPALLLIVWCERPSVNQSWRDWLRKQTWVLFVWVGMCSVPTAWLGRLKVGGSANSFSPVVFFWVLGMLTYLNVIRGERRAPVRVGLTLFAASVTFFGLQQQIFFFRDYQGLGCSKEARAIRFLEEHPGSAYFPWNPLAHLAAEGRLCHFAYGLFDRELGGFPIADEHFRAHVPMSCRYVCFPPGRRSHRPPQCLDRFLEHFPRQVTLKELPGFECFERAE